MTTEKQTPEALALEEFKHWLDERRTHPVSYVFHEIVHHYEAALAQRQQEPGDDELRAVVDDAARYQFLCAHPHWQFVEHLCRQFAAHSATQFKAGMDRAIDAYREAGTTNWQMVTAPPVQKAVQADPGALTDAEVIELAKAAGFGSLTHVNDETEPQAVKDAGRPSKLDRECLRLGQEIQRAAGELPEGWNIEIELENGSGSVVLVDPQGVPTYFNDMVDGMSYALTEAIDAAIAATKKDTPLTLETAPIGTKAPAVTGGHWTKVAGGWKWCTGDTFPRPGGDWTGELVPPAAAEAPKS